MNNETTIQLIYQYLNDQQYVTALQALQEDSKVAYDCGVFANKPNRLRSILDEHFELNQAMLPVDPHSQMDMTVEQNLRVHACEKAPNCQRAIFDTISNTGLITARTQDLSDGTTLLITSAANKEIKLFNIASVLFANPTDKPDSIGAIISPSTCLAIEFHPTIEGMIAMGSMDGSVKVMKNAHLLQRTITFDVIQHEKYVVRVKWGGKFLASASYDKTVSLFKLQDESAPESGKFEFYKKWSFCGNVESIEFTKDANTLIVSVRDDNYLNYINLTSFEISRVNMNANGDDHVSFTAMHIQLSPSGDHLLVQTDRDRIIVMRTHTSVQTRNLYGTINNEFSQPRAVWHPSGAYIYGTSQNNQIIAWDVMTEKITYRLRGHTGYPRDLFFHEKSGELITCSYDRTVRIWEAENE